MSDMPKDSAPSNSGDGDQQKEREGARGKALAPGDARHIIDRMGLSTQDDPRPEDKNPQPGRSSHGRNRRNNRRSDHANKWERGNAPPQKQSKVAAQPSRPAEEDESQRKNKTASSSSRREEQQQQSKQQAKGTDTERRNKGASRKRKPRSKKVDYVSGSTLERNLENGTYVRGQLRINAKNRQQAYVSVIGSYVDILLNGENLRNRALNDDIVAVALDDITQWPVMDGTVSQTSPTTAGDFKTSSTTMNMSTVPDQMSLPSRKEEEQQQQQPDIDIDIAADIAKLQIGDSIASSDSSDENANANANENKTTGLSQLLALQHPSNIRPTGRVVAILEERGERENIMGYLRILEGGRIDNEGVLTAGVSQLLFVPLEERAPCMLCAPPVTVNADERALVMRTLYLARMTSWPLHSARPLGEIRKAVGEMGEIESETNALLMRFHVDCSEFEADCLDPLPSAAWEIPPAEIAQRRDFRQHCVFTIDPATARDLDDALHVVALPHGRYEVGVHIADVSYFVEKGTPLDRCARERSTSVYLVQKVIPMLPRRLCEDLCSLNPGVDRLAFSAVFIIDRDGTVQEEWFGRSVIRSCAKLAYEHAQAVIDKKIETPAQWQSQIVQSVTIDGQWSAKDLIGNILHLDMLAKKRRQSRYDNGALSLQKVKLYFSLDEKGNPVDTAVQVTSTANWLIEEFMLLANIRVATKIADAFPETALLRRHPPPNERKLDLFVQRLKSYGVHVSSHSGKAIAESLNIYKSQPLVLSVVSQLLVRSMQLAEYINSGEYEVEEWRHYALNTDRYTHFTSPIRRYPDVIVHRLLQAALRRDLAAETEWKNLLSSFNELTVTTDIANEKKLLARKAGEASSDVFFCLLFKDRVEEVQALVYEIWEGGCRVVMTKYGAEHRFNKKDLPAKYCEFDSTRQSLTLIPSRKVITFLTQMTLKVTLSPKLPLELKVTIVSIGKPLKIGSDN